MGEESAKTQEPTTDGFEIWVVVPVGFVARAAFYLAMGWIAHAWFYTGAFRKPLASVSLSEIFGDLLFTVSISGLVWFFASGFKSESFKDDLRIWGWVGFFLAFLGAMLSYIF